ncbi:MAG: outer membrane beta-barrel family protein [Bacteroidota bacterium]
MSKLTVLLLATLMFSGLFSSAQNITGKIVDTAGKKNISNAVVALLIPGDSILYKFTRTNPEGKFEFKNAKSGSYILMITHPYYANFLDSIAVKEGNLDLKQIPFISKSQLLQEVIVKSGSPIKIKGDTTEYNADSFQVKANANVEELLRKLPGIQVDKNGTITAMGEKVTKVLVDGEEFFGDDPGIAVKNLRADAVDKVQVFDKKSDQAAFTGIDDGVKDKTINLKLKDDKKKGYFGKVSGSGGLPANYNNTAMLNAFKAKRKLAGYGIMSNTGQTNLDWQDQNNYGGGMGDMMSVEDNGDIYFFGGGDGEDNYRGGRNGIPRSWNGGLHYSDKYNNNKISLNSGYKYNKVNSLGNTTVFSKIFLPDTSWTNNSSNKTYSSRTKHAFNLTYEVMLDSFNTIKWTAKANNSKTQSSSEYMSAALANNGDFINNSNRNTTNTADNNAINGTLLWKHKFKKPFRTLSLNSDFNWNESKNDGFLLSYNGYYKGGQMIRRDTIDQENLRDNENTGWNSKLAYTEPLFKDAFMEFSYAISKNSNANNRLSRQKDNSGKYLDVVDSLSNRFEFDRLVNRPGINFRYNKKKLNYAIGSSVAFNRFKQKNLSRNTEYMYNFVNYFPTAMFSYKMNGNKNFRLNYNGSATAPSLEQLQPIKDNTDPLNIFEGNPNLDQSFRHNFNVSYNFYNVLKEQGMWSNLQYSTTNNAFVQSSTIDSTGVRRYKTVNADGVRNLSFYLDYSLKLKGSGLRLSFTPNINNSQNIDFVNNNKNINKTTSYGLGLGVGKYVDNKYNFEIRPNYSFNHSTSDLNASANIDYWQFSSWINGSVNLPLKFEINTDMNIEVRQKDPRFPANNNYVLWNASLKKKFMDNKLEAEFGVNDILNQNRGFQRNFNSSSFTETYYNTMRRYWMMTVTWNFNSSGAKPTSGF